MSLTTGGLVRAGLVSCSKPKHASRAAKIHFSFDFIEIRCASIRESSILTQILIVKLKTRKHPLTRVDEESICQRHEEDIFGNSIYASRAFPAALPFSPIVRPGASRPARTCSRLCQRTGSSAHRAGSHLRDDRRRSLGGATGRTRVVAGAA